MKKVFAILAIAGLMVACNNDAKTEEVKKDSAAIIDSMNKMMQNTKDSVNKMLENTQDSVNKMMSDSMPK